MRYSKLAKTSFKWILAAVWSTGMGLVLLELLLRASQGWYFEAIDLYQVDEILGIAMRPSISQSIGIGDMRFSVSHNSSGLRGAEVREDDPELRIFLIGDSYVYGIGTDNDGTISYQLENMMKQTGIDAEVLNLGCGGYSTVQAYYMLQKYKHLNPDVVLYLFCDNDPIDNIKFLTGVNKRRSPKTYRSWWRIALRRHSMVWNVIQHKRFFF
ncbi:MAG: SGNH/GDSL hydrolase family protein, partial [bacterium]